MFNIEKELKKLPAKPGVYIMRDKDNNIIYVGKAVVLKNRVKQYFRKTNKTARRLTCSIFNGDLAGSPKREAEGGPVWETRFYHLYSSSNS